ncbi:universal stress protein [Rubrivirga sp. IMCC45206]|uniref:universal stress protein n=1 Tax=Rubrivirga sp. IMCC45206 TaxID=3391614 RepID=UPI0039900C3E
MSPIVAAVDFSPGSERAAALAAALAARAGTPLHLVHADVLFRSDGGGAAPGTVPSSALRLRLERLAATLGRPDASVAVTRHTSATTALAGYTQRERAGLLVVGTHGRSGLRRLLLGSVAEACIASAPCPVLAVPDGAAPALAPTAPILVAVDFSGRSRAALSAAHALAGWTGAPVELVHVIRDGGPYPPIAPGVLSLSDVDPTAADSVRERLWRFAAQGPDPAPADVHAGLGAPGRVIAALAAERGAGAIVIGTHGRTGLAWLVGSVAASTLRRSPCPVLTLTEAVRMPRPVHSALS